MAFAARLGALTEELVVAITPNAVIETNSNRLKVLRDTSLQEIRQHSFLRTNQFDVRDHLLGLEEHFRILNRDGLADALRDRLRVLERISNSLTPEVLHFLLELSDQPVQKSRLDDLVSLRQPRAAPGSILKWSEIANEDDWAADRDLWTQVDFRGDDTSDEENTHDLSDASAGSDETSFSSVEAHHRRQPADLVIPPEEDSELHQVIASQSWRRLISSPYAQKRSENTTISELQAVREILFVLHGLDNDIVNGTSEPAANFQLHHATGDSFQALLGSFGAIGQDLYNLRRFAQKKQQTPLMQVFHATIEQRLRVFETRLSSIELGLIDLKQETVVSLTKVLEDVKTHTEGLSALASITHQLEREKHPRPFRYLELLFDQTSLAQLVGNDHVFRFLGVIFFECFRLYLHPIERWMARGELYDEDKVFFIYDTKLQLSLDRVWFEQFKLRKSTEGDLYVPKFLRPAIDRILLTGKSVVILKHLRKYGPMNTMDSEPFVTFEDLISTELGDFVPFPEMFHAAFDSWMQGTYHAASTTLRSLLFESCKVVTVLSTLQHLYLMTDGSRSDQFAHGLFRNLDLVNARWYDRFLLTELANAAFSGIVETEHITVSVSEHNNDGAVEARRSVRNCLPAIKIHYRVSWPLRIILTEEDLTHYQAIFTFLLQIRRARYMLQKSFVRLAAVSGFESEGVEYYALRSRLLWFCESLQSYLSNLVFAPLAQQLQGDLVSARDVDAMRTAHASFAKRVSDAACLGSRLQPIRECMLDMMDLAIRLEDAHEFKAQCEAAETQELSRLVEISPVGLAQADKRDQKGRYVSISDEEDESFLYEQDTGVTTTKEEQSYTQTLAEVRNQYDRHLKFICGGLRGTARASGDASTGMWETLAEMLEAGIKEDPW